MKTQEELNVLKNECKTFTNKLRELSEDELKQVIGGANVEWLYEHSFDVNEGGHKLGSNQEVIGEWPIKEH